MTVGADGGASEEVLGAEVGLVVGGGGPEGEEVFVLEEGVEAAEAEAEEDAGGEGAAALAGHEDVGAGGALGVDEGVVLVDDELAAQRDHEEDAEPAAEEGEGEDAGGLEIEAEEDERGQGEDDAGGDGLAGVAGGLDDVVFEDGGFAEGAEDGDGEDGDGDGGGDGEAGAEADVDGDGSEEDAEDGAEEEGAGGELGAGFGGGDEGFEVLRGCHAVPGLRWLVVLTTGAECISGGARNGLTAGGWDGLYCGHGAV